MWLWIIFAICVLIFIYLYVFNSLNYISDNAIFFPSKFDTKYRPSCSYDNLYLDVDGSDYCKSYKHKKKEKDYISAWHFYNFPDKPTIVFFHGTTGNLTNRSYIIDFCNKFQLNLFVFDYSGYGESSNCPSKTLLTKNADTVYNYLHCVKKIPNKDIVLWSESLGCFAASYLASKYKFRALILLSAFSSLDEILKHKVAEGYMRQGFTVLTKILSWQMDFLPVYKYLESVKCKTIIVHSEFDELINWECALTNFNSIPTKYKSNNKHNENKKYNNEDSEDKYNDRKEKIEKRLIKITGGHSSPHITKKQLKIIFNFCEIDSEIVHSHSISKILNSLENFAKKHNNFNYV